MNLHCFKRDTPPEPMDECDVQLIIKIGQIRKKHGSLANFYAHLEKEREAKNAAICADQIRRIQEAWAK